MEIRLIGQSMILSICEGLHNISRQSPVMEFIDYCINIRTYVGQLSSDLWFCIRSDHESNSQPLYIKFNFLNVTFEIKIPTKYFTANLQQIN